MARRREGKAADAAGSRAEARRRRRGLAFRRAAR
jgi:hypothetical protein